MLANSELALIARLKIIICIHWTPHCWLTKTNQYHPPAIMCCFHGQQYVVSIDVQAGRSWWISACRLTCLLLLLLLLPILCYDVAMEILWLCCQPKMECQGRPFLSLHIIIIQQSIVCGKARTVYVCLREHKLLSTTCDSRVRATSRASYVSTLMTKQFSQI